MTGLLRCVPLPGAVPLHRTYVTIVSVSETPPLAREMSAAACQETPLPPTPKSRIPVRGGSAVWRVRIESRLAHERETIAKEKKRVEREREELGREIELVAEEKEKCALEHERVACSREKLALERENRALERELLASAQEKVAIERELVATTRELLAAEREAFAYDKEEEMRVRLSEQAGAPDIAEINADSRRDFNDRLIEAVVDANETLKAIKSQLDPAPKPEPNPTPVKQNVLVRYFNKIPPVLLDKFYDTIGGFIANYGASRASIATRGT